MSYEGERRVQGHCPMGCGQTLFLGAGGYVTCSYLKCPRPDAASKILDDAETEHIVEFAPDGFSIRHPIRERLDDGVKICVLYSNIVSLGGPPIARGTYRARKDNVAGWTWEPLTDKAFSIWRSPC